MTKKMKALLDLQNYIVLCGGLAGLTVIYLSWTARHATDSTLVLAATVLVSAVFMAEAVHGVRLQLKKDKER